MRDDCGRLADILEAVERIEKYSQRGRLAFENDELIQTWIVHHLQILGEAARALSDTTRAATSQIPWRQIIGMRHILVHQYFGIDTDIVWNVVENELPGFHKQVELLRDQLSAAESPDDSPKKP